MILDTRNFQDSMEALIENIKAKLVEAGAIITAITNRGQLKFRRVTDRKFPAGIYLQVAFEAPAGAPGVIRSKFRLDSTVNRVFIESK
ncbi:MAG: 30S ribosomal protein S6 [Puniceicoccales bacterium]|jgi:small subunit ribosomal protein S6|nr:30S ribosomal protein S6 [Puniceicoccales bacterium]